MSAIKKSKKRKRIIVGSIIIGIVAVAVAFASKPEVTIYESAEAKKGDITTYYHFSGNIESQNKQNVIADKVMQITEIKVEEGDMVKEGDVLFETSYGEDIESKINGEISTIHVEEDEQVMAASPLIDITDYKNMEIIVKVDEYDLGAIKENMDATVTISAIDKEIMGKIKSISKEGQVENGVTFFTATIDLEEEENIKIGMSAEIKVLSHEVKDVVSLPMSAIQFEDNNEAYVQKKDENREIYKEKIEVGINDGITVEIKKGVSAGETVYYTEANGFEAMVMTREHRENGIGGGEN
ncbi:efflux RND transporter periplasmic adaptor subunit [Alkalibaculum bacchi]|uniref:efflux RND transporter periplasmic adaptor subunit n=1 Tax=Alkalibaculum bacchi TaxID=645887 RepID=UPI0026EA2D17|nr:HlyD family efflux transporter periplasmic adaptor subunit [Alkalibaculum bacchi]